MQSDFICWFLLTLFIGVFADNRTVEQGSLVLLFENVVADNTEKVVDLYVNGDGNPTLVVTFKFVNGSHDTDWKTDNYSKIFMDAKGNIKIANIDETYAKTFYIQSSDIQSFKIIGAVELTILNKKTVEQGSLVLLFKNVVADNTDKEVNLYVNRVVNSTLVVTFKIVNGVHDTYWKTDTYSKIFMDAKGNIKIANIDETYAKTFYIQYSKILGAVELTFLRNLTEDEVQKWLDDHPGFMKKYFGNLTGEKIGEIRKLLDAHTGHIREYLGNLTGEKIGEIRKLLDAHTGHIRKYLESRDSLMIYLLIAILVIVSFTIIIVVIFIVYIIYRLKVGKYPIQETQRSRPDDNAHDGTGETNISLLPKLSGSVKKEMH